MCFQAEKKMKDDLNRLGAPGAFFIFLLATLAATDFFFLLAIVATVGPTGGFDTGIVCCFAEIGLEELQQREL